MKKRNILIFIFTFIFSFSFLNNVDAYSCLYKGTDDNDKEVTFKVLDRFDPSTKEVYISAVALNEFTSKGEHQDANSSWSTWNKNLYIVKENSSKASRLPKDENCTKYMYYVVKKGSNKIYFSDIEPGAINTKYKGDMVLELVSGLSSNGEISACSSSTIGDCNMNKGELDELFCTYTSPGIMTKTFSFRVQGNTFTLFDNYDEIGNYYLGDSYGYGIFKHTDTYEVYATLRNFWNENYGWWDCPTTIDVKTVVSANETAFKIGTHETFIENQEEYEKTFWDWFNGYGESTTTYSLNSASSYIKLVDNTNLASQVCSYTRPNEVCDPTSSNCVTKNYVTLAEYNYDGKLKYEYFFNTGLTANPKGNVTIDIPNQVITSSCNDMPTIYTSCLDTTFHELDDGRTGGGHHIGGVNDCKISTSEFPGSQKLVSSTWNNEQDIISTLNNNSIKNGLQYKRLICDLNKKLMHLPDTSKFSNLPALKIYDFEGLSKADVTVSSLNSTYCSEWGVESDFNCYTDECKNNINYNVNRKIRDVYSYCQTIYSMYYSNSGNSTLNKGRYEECKSFETFYDSLVSNGIISNIFEGCNIVSGEFGDKLIFILNIIKIAGPIMAIGLGMIDFVKAVAAADADKEMREAAKRFKYRLIAVVLLFLIPVLLSFLINIFIGDEINNNPYCGLLEELNDSKGSGSSSADDKPVDDSPDFNEDYIH